MTDTTNTGEMCLATKRNTRLTGDAVAKGTIGAAILAITAWVIAVAVFCGVLATDTDSQRREEAYRTVEETFAVRRSQGWELTKAPEDGKRYRICGALESGRDAERRSFSGRFSTGDRFVDFDVAIPQGKMVAVEGLDPFDGGPLTYAVLTKDLPSEKVVGAIIPGHHSFACHASENPSHGTCGEQPRSRFVFGLLRCRDWRLAMAATESIAAAIALDDLCGLQEAIENRGGGWNVTDEFAPSSRGGCRSSACCEVCDAA